MRGCLHLLVVPACVLAAAACKRKAGDSGIESEAESEAEAESESESEAESEAESEGEPVEVDCGDMTCIAPDVCCADLGGGWGGGPPSFECALAADCPTGSDPFACDGPEDCDAPDVCCLQFGGGAACEVASAGCTRVCHEDADCTGSDTCCIDPDVSETSGVCSDYWCV